MGLLIAGRASDSRALLRFIPDCLVLFRGLLSDPEIATARKAVLIPMIAYLASPIDFVPDFVPVIGVLDDAIVVVLALRFLLRGASPDLLRRYWRGDEATLKRIIDASYGRAG